MRYLIITDLHANLEGLQACLAAAEGRYDTVICCGDIVGYGPDPNAVTDWVRANVVAVVRGNHDKACCGITDAEEFNQAARDAALWTRDCLTPENLEYLRNLPVGPTVVDGFQIVHGSIRDEDEYVFVVQDAAQDFPNLGHQLTFFGHTHLQGGFAQLPDQELRAIRPSYHPGIATLRLEIEENVTYLVNPGSTGQPRDGDSRAAFVIYYPDEGRGLVEYWRVPYEIEATQKKMMSAGLPQVLALRLNFGR